MDESEETGKFLQQRLVLELSGYIHISTFKYTPGGTHDTKFQIVL